MTNLEIKKNHWITLANEGKVTVLEAADALGLSTRQIKRLKKGVKEKGVEAIIHGNRSKENSWGHFTNLWNIYSKLICFLSFLIFKSQFLSI